MLHATLLTTPTVFNIFKELHHARRDQANYTNEQGHTQDNYTTGHHMTSEWPNQVHVMTHDIVKNHNYDLYRMYGNDQYRCNHTDIISIEFCRLLDRQLYFLY